MVWIADGRSLTGNAPAGRERMFEAGQLVAQKGIGDREVRRKILAAHDTIFHEPSSSKREVNS
jgi:hypothetical protein